MKKILLLIVILLLLGGGYYWWQSSSNPSASLPQANTGGDTEPDPSNATFIIEDESITLSQGRHESAPLPGSAILEETILMDKFAYGDLNADGREDTALLLARYGGGSGTFIYVAAFVSGPVNYKGTDAIFLGDRVAVKSISINQGVVTVNYLDRKPHEPFAAEPTVSESKQFIYRSGVFQER